MKQFDSPPSPPTPNIFVIQVVTGRQQHRGIRWFLDSRPQQCGKDGTCML